MEADINTDQMAKTQEEVYDEDDQDDQDREDEGDDDADDVALHAKIKYFF